MFVVTSTYSYNIATPSGAYDKTYNGAAELYIYKLNSDLSTRSNSTYFGGAVDEVPHSAETDSDGNLYITGYTSSTNFTTTADVFDKTFGGVEDGFIIKFDNNLNNLLASTFLGGSKSDRSQAIKIKDGKIYVTGRTLSSDFPIVTGSYDDEFSGGLEHGDISVSVMDLDLTTMYASTYLGGPADEKSLGLAVDNDDNVFIGGFSHSSGYPTTIDAYDQSFGGVIDVIVAKFNFDNVLGVNQENSTPKEFILLQNYPNPFNPTTTIEYQLKEESNVVLTIYNVLGNEVRTIVYERQSIGTKKVIWDGKDNFGKSVSSGVYYYRIKAGDFIQAKKMSLIK